MLKDTKGQAILELAILGSLIIMAFSIVIGLSENYNRAQSYMQQTFRSTLKQAQDANDAGSVSTVDFRRMPNVSNPVDIGALGFFSSGNSLIWSDGKKKDGEFTKSKTYFLHNRGGYELLEEGPPGVIPFSVTVSNTNYSTALNATAFSDVEVTPAGGSPSAKTLHATDTIGGSTTVGTHQPGIGGNLGDHGVYTGSGPMDWDAGGV